MKMTDDAMRMRSGTSLRGHINAHYSQLVELFGEPYADGSNHKTDAEWIIPTPHGPAAIYNYKNGFSYLGLSGLKLEEMDEWHVGGKNSESYEWVVQQLATG